MPRQLDRFIHSGRQRYIHVQCLCQSRPQHGAHRRVQLGDGLFRKLIYTIVQQRQTLECCVKNARGKGGVAAVQRRGAFFQLGVQHKVGVAVCS